MAEEDYLKHAEAVLRRLGTKDKPEATFFSLVTAENLQRIQVHIFLIGTITVVLSIAFFGLLLLGSGAKHYDKLKKMWYAPKSAMDSSGSPWLLATRCQKTPCCAMTFRRTGSRCRSWP